MITSPRLTVVPLLLIIIVLVAGCGEKTITAPQASKLEESQNCIDCHQAKISQVSGASITDEWKLSVHNTKNKAGCGDCHEPETGHPDNCTRCHGLKTATTPGYEIGVIRNPDSAGICSKCHSKAAGFTTTTYNGSTVNTLQAHFTNITSGVIPRVYAGLYFSNISTFVITGSATATANWASANYNPVKGDPNKYGCRACHNPHDTTSKIDIYRQWARSGHGDTASAARTSVDFKTRGSNEPANTTAGAICVRCHTSTGFINYVKSDFMNVAAFELAGSPNHSKEVTGCNVCHDDGKGNAYGYALRNVLAANPARAGVPAYYNYSAATGGNSKATPSTTVRGSEAQITYPNVSNSNVCVVCHMGREIGRVIKLESLKGLDFSRTARVNAHDFAAGANLFQESGFEFYTSSAKYPDTNFLHYKAGTNNFQGTGSRGPCIACHMNSTQSHSFMPITKENNGTVTAIISKTCAKCHPSAVTNNKDMNKDILEKNRQGFKAAMTVLRGLLTRSGVRSIGTLKTDGTGTITYKTDWTKACTGTAAAQSAQGIANFIVPASGNLAGGPDSIRAAAYTMGAAFNYELLYFDFGAYVHNPNYIKRLIFDSIDWLDDCALSTQGGADVCANVITDVAAREYLCGKSGLRP